MTQVGPGRPQLFYKQETGRGKKERGREHEGRGLSEEDPTAFCLVIKTLLLFFFNSFLQYLKFLESLCDVASNFLDHAFLGLFTFSGIWQKTMI